MNEEIVEINEEKTKTEYPIAVQKILRDFADVFPKDLPVGLPPASEVDHRIDLIPVQNFLIEHPTECLLRG